jgi:integrase
MKDVRKRQLKLPDFKPDPKFEDLVFLKDNGKPYDLNEDNDLWNSVVARYGKRGVRIRQHSLRHVSGTRLADANVSREIAMAILGHESESMSFYYGRMTQRGQVEQLGKFGEAISAKIKPAPKN